MRRRGNGYSLMPSNPIKIFVADTGPLITLAAADSLDYLKYPDAPVTLSVCVTLFFLS